MALIFLFQRNLKCLAFAELYKKAGELELAKR